MQIFSLVVVTPPKVGKIEILGSGFRYTPDPNTPAGADTFKLQISGKNRRDLGKSTIEITVGPGEVTKPAANDELALHKPDTDTL